MYKDLLVAFSPRSCWRFLTLLLRWRLVSLRLLVTDLGSLLGAGLPLLLLLVSASSPVQTLLSGPGKEDSKKFFIIASISSYMDKYTIRSIICKASCHPVPRSLGHLVTRSLGHLVTRSLDHLVTLSLSHWSLHHSVTQSLGHSVTQSLGLTVFQS